MVDSRRPALGTLLPAVILTAVVMLASCGGDDETPTPTAATPSGASTTPSEPATASPSATAAAASRELAAGDCFDLWAAGGHDTTPASCSGPHDAEIVGTVPLEAGQSADSPVLQSQARIRCYTRAAPVLARQPNATSLVPGTLEPALMTTGGGPGSSFGCFLARNDKGKLTAALA